MRAILFLITAMAAGLFTAGPSAASIYSLNYTEGSIDVTGKVYTYTSDAGPVGSGDIFYWSFVAKAPGISLDLTPAGGTLLMYGDDLVATGTELTFNFGADDGGYFGAYEAVDGGGSFPNGFPILCNATAGNNFEGCTEGGVTLGNPLGAPDAEAFAAATGTVVLGVVPEPST